MCQQNSGWSARWSEARQTFSHEIGHAGLAHRVRTGHELIAAWKQPP
jgi:hypothetical protein